MRFSLKTSEQTYGVKIGCTAQSVTADVQPRVQTYGQSVTGEHHFYQPSHSSYFPCSRVVLVEVGLIEGFPQIWRPWITWITQRRYSTQVSFNSHNAQCYFPCISHLFCVPRKHVYLKHLLFILTAHEFQHFEKNGVLNMLIK